MAGGRNSPWLVIFYLSLYCATQGLYDAWDEAFELTFLTGYGVSLGYVGLTQTLAIIPWCFKVYISMPSEYRVRCLRVKWLHTATASTGALQLEEGAMLF